MPKGIVFTATAFSPEWDIGSEWDLAHWWVGQGIPEPNPAPGIDYAIAVGRFPSHSQASELGGMLRLLAEGGTTAVFLYPGSIEGPDGVLLGQMLPEYPGLGSFVPPLPTPALEPVFNSYLTAYGRSNVYLASWLGTTARDHDRPGRNAG